MPGIYMAMEIARKAMTVNQTAIQVTAHNIANVNTPGYSRQEAIIEEAQAVSSSPGQLGLGSIVSSIQRKVDTFAESQLLTENGTFNSLQYSSQAIGQVEAIFNDTSGAGISERINEFFNAWDDLAANPQGMAERQAVVSNADLLTSEFRNMDEQIQTLQQSTNKDVASIVSEINQIVTKIADLNGSIKVALAENQQPNDLMDQRGVLLKSLAEKIGFTSVTDSLGQVSVYIGNGRALVDGESAGSLVAELQVGTENLFNDVKVRLPGQGGNNLDSIATSLTSGQLASALSFRDGYLNTVKSRLDTLAYAIGMQVNGQHLSGYGLPMDTVPAGVSSVTDPTTGKQVPTGVPFFSAMAGVKDAARNFNVNPSVLSDLRLVAAAGATNASGNVVLTGIPADGTTLSVGGKTYEFTSGAASGTNIKVDTAAAYLASLNLGGSTSAAVAKALELAAAANKGTDPFTITAHGGIVMAVADAAGAAGNAITMSESGDSGNLVLLSGATFSGGVDTPAPPPNPGDNRNSLVMGGLRNVGSAVLGNSTASDYYAGIIGRIGTEAQGVNIDLDHQKVIVDYLESRREQSSGVSLDEEMTNLIKYQRAFEASTKMIAVVDQLLDTIINKIKT